MANSNPKPGPGRPKGSKNKTPILLQELETVIFELPKEERLKRLRAFRDFSAHNNPHKNFVTMHLAVAKTQEANDQQDLFDHSEEQAMIMAAQKAIENIQERPGITH